MHRSTWQSLWNVIGIELAHKKGDSYSQVEGSLSGWARPVCLTLWYCKTNMMLKELLMLFFQEGLICVSDRVILLQVVTLFVLWWAWPVTLLLIFPCTHPQYHSVYHSCTHPQYHCDIGCVRIRGRGLSQVGSDWNMEQRPRCKKNWRHKLRNPLDCKKRFLFLSDPGPIIVYPCH